VKASPLFNIRSSRAIDEESEDLSCEYVGKGILTNINIPSRNIQMILLQDFVQKIAHMDETELKDELEILTNSLEDGSNNNLFNGDIQDWTFDCYTYSIICLLIVVLCNVSVGNIVWEI